MQRTAFAALALWDAMHPIYWFVTHIRNTGTGLPGLIDAWYVNASTTGLTRDLTISTLALTIWVLTKAQLRRNWLALLAIPATFGVSCGLPLYLLLRSRPAALQS